MVCARYVLVISFTAHPRALFNKYKILCFPEPRRTFRKQMLTFSSVWTGSQRCCSWSRRPERLCASGDLNSVFFETRLVFCCYSTLGCCVTQTHTYTESLRPRLTAKRERSAFNDRSRPTTTSPAQSNNWIEFHCNMSNRFSLRTDCTAWSEHNPQSNWS